MEWAAVTGKEANDWKELEVLQKDCGDLGNQARWWALVWALPIGALVFGDGGHFDQLRTWLRPDGNDAMQTLIGVGILVWAAAGVSLAFALAPRSFGKIPVEYLKRVNVAPDQLTTRVDKAARQIMIIRWAISAAELLMVWSAGGIAAVIVGYFIGRTAWMVSLLLLEVVATGFLAVVVVGAFDHYPKWRQSGLARLGNWAWARATSVRNHGWHP
jgi:hypothetical protein